MGVLKEFKEFAIKSRVIDLAVGVVIGAAFTKIITSFIEDVVTPIILKPNLLASHFTKLEELRAYGTVKYGLFIASLINFIIVALSLFLDLLPQAHFFPPRVSLKVVFSLLLLHA